MTKQKVSDLPKEEQEKIIAQMKELKIHSHAEEIKKCILDIYY